MLNIAICDDVNEEVAMIKNKTEKILNQLSLDYIIHTFDNKQEMFFSIGNGNIDVLLLDIRMPDIDGFEIAKRFSDKVEFIIFVSGNDNFVFESIKYSPYRFVRKSHMEELYEAFESIKEYYNDSYYIDIKTIDCGKISVRLKDIIYIESHADKLTIYTEGCEYEIRNSLKKIETMLDKTFMRVHRGFIINLDKIYQIKRFEVELVKNGEIITVPLKRNLHNEVKQRFVEVMRR